MDIMYTVGKKLPAELRETALGGCALSKCLRKMQN